MARYRVYLRAGYYPAESDIAKEDPLVTRVPRVIHGPVEAQSVSDAMAKTVAAMALLFKENGYPSTLIEPVAATLIVPTHEELLASLPLDPPPVPIVRVSRF